MLNRELMEERLTQIRISSNRLKLMKSISLEQFLSNPDNFAIAEHHLRRALESLFDLGRHVISKKSLGRPENYSQIIELLGQHRVLPPEFSNQIKGMAGYRNRLVHEYARISSEELYDIIQTRLEDFAQFCSYIVDYLDVDSTYF